MNQAEAPTHILTIKKRWQRSCVVPRRTSQNPLSGTIPGVPRLTHFAVGRRKLVRRKWLDAWLEASRKR